MTDKTLVELVTRSMVCISGVPILLGDHEWFIPGPGRVRRAVQPGDHLPADHPLVIAYPDSFAPSAEPPTAWPISLLTPEARERQQQATVRLDPYPTRKVTPCCLRCGAESETSVILLEVPKALDMNAELSGLDDSDFRGRMAIEAKYAARARAAHEQTATLAHAEQQWRAEHVACPEGTPPLPEPKVPEEVPLFYRLDTFRTLDR
jgi:hypothetical protein